MYHNSTLYCLLFFYKLKNVKEKARENRSVRSNASSITYSHPIKRKTAETPGDNGSLPKNKGDEKETFRRQITK